eukprot:jgi/Hompol1/5372/HPOL_001198-RA
MLNLPSTASLANLPIYDRLKPSQWRQLLFIATVVALLCIFVPLAIVLDFNESDKKSQNYGYSTLDSKIYDSISSGAISFDGIIVLGSINSIDPISRILKLHVQLFPLGIWNKDATSNNTDPMIFSRLSDGITALISGSEISFKKGGIMAPYDVIVPMSDGSLSDYPFDVYNVVFDFSATNTTSGLSSSSTGYCR